MAAARKKAPPTRIQRAGSGHSYFLDGEKAPGVTTILNAGIPKPGLIGWAGGVVADFVVNRLNVARTAEGKTRIVADELVADLLEWNASRGSHAVKVSTGEALPRLALAKILGSIRYRDLTEASTKGTDVHKLAERLARGEEVEVPEHLKGYVESYLRFLEEWNPTEALVERVVVNRRWRYMGKTDMIARFEGTFADGKPIGRAIVDLKTARSGIFAETALQLAGYANGETMLEGEEEIPLGPIDSHLAVWIRADGYDVYRFEVTPETFRVFLYAKQVGEWLDWKEGPAATVKSGSLNPPKEINA